MYAVGYNREPSTCRDCPAIKCYHLKRNLQVWSFLIDVLHRSKTYLRTSHSWLSCNGKINHSIRSAIWCLSDFDVLHRDKCCWNEHQSVDMTWILFSMLKKSILEELSKVLLKLSTFTSRICGITKHRPWPVSSKLKLDLSIKSVNF